MLSGFAVPLAFRSDSHENRRVISRSAFSNARPNPLFRPTLLTKGAPPKKH